MTCLQPSNAANDNRPLPTKLERKGLIIMITLIISYVLTYKIPQNGVIFER